MPTRQFLSSLRRQLPRSNPRSPLPHTSSPLSRLAPRRHKSSSSSSSSTTTSSSSSASTTSRATRILSRLPPSLQKYASRLRGAPLSHVVAFLVLHEITAIVPLVGLFGVFHYYFHDAEGVVLPVAGYMTEHYGGYVSEGLGRFERYFRRKGWFGFGEDDGGREDLQGERQGEKGEGGTALERWRSDGRYRVVVEVALAYAITKVLLPVRIMVSLWATPWFAGVLGRARMLVRKRPPP